MRPGEMKRFWLRFKFWLAMLTDRRTPLFVKIIPALGLLYLILPFDLITDQIPVLGWLDDLGVISLLVALALRFVPPEVRKRVYGIFYL